MEILIKMTTSYVLIKNRTSSTINHRKIPIASTPSSFILQEVWQTHLREQRTMMINTHVITSATKMWKVTNLVLAVNKDSETVWGIPAAQRTLYHVEAALSVKLILCNIRPGHGCSQFAAKIWSTLSKAFFVNFHPQSWQALLELLCLILQKKGLQSGNFLYAPLIQIE